MSILELLTTDFILNAVIGGLILAILLSVLSLFIYVKKWSFINVGISHAAFGGLAIGYLTGISPSITGSIFAILVGVLIGFLSRKGKFHEDISIGILLSFSMAFGVILISLSNNYNSDLFSFLFGNILTITREDITILGIFTVISFGFLYIYFQRLLYCCFDEEVAKVSGVKTDFLYYSLIVLMAIAIVLSIKLVGSILASAMMILPTATSSQVFWHYRNIIISSIIVSIFVVITGIFISFEFNLPSGSTIVMVYSVIFFVITAVKRFFK